MGNAVGIDNATDLKASKMEIYRTLKTELEATQAKLEKEGKKVRRREGSVGGWRSRSSLRSLSFFAPPVLRPFRPSLPHHNQGSTTPPSPPKRTPYQRRTSHPSQARSSL